MLLSLDLISGPNSVSIEKQKTKNYAGSEAQVERLRLEILVIVVYYLLECVFRNIFKNKKS